MLFVPDKNCLNPTCCEARQRPQQPFVGNLQAFTCLSLSHRLENVGGQEEGREGMGDLGL